MYFSGFVSSHASLFSWVDVDVYGFLCLRLLSFSVFRCDNCCVYCDYVFVCYSALRGLVLFLCFHLKFLLGVESCIWFLLCMFCNLCVCFLFWLVTRLCFIFGFFLVGLILFFIDLQVLVLLLVWQVLMMSLYSFWLCVAYT